jgi:hypothetical protein
MAPIRDRKAIPAALDANQPTISFAPETEGQRTNPLTDRSVGVGPMHGTIKADTDYLGVVAGSTPAGELARVPVRVA